MASQASKCNFFTFPCSVMCVNPSDTGHLNSLNLKIVIGSDFLLLSHASAGFGYSSLRSSRVLSGPDNLPLLPVKILRNRLWKVWCC